MLICRDCGQTFEEEEAKTVSEYAGEYWGAPARREYSVCPYCGSEDFEKAVPCEICGEYFDPDEIYYADKWRICLGCKDEIEKKYREWTQEIEAAFSGTFDKIEQAVIGELQMDGVID